MTNAAEWAALVGGLVFGLSLIIVVGPQNTYVLRQGVLRDHVATVVAICAASDVVLVAAGVGGASAILDDRHWLLPGLRVVGAAFLFGYGSLAAYRASKGGTSRAEGARPGSSWATVVAVCLGFTWLNPWVYLDTVVLLGTVANTRPGHQWWFGSGAAMASVLWFVVLGFGARVFAPLLSRPRAWQVLDGLVAVVMTGTGLRVLLGT